MLFFLFSFACQSQIMRGYVIKSFPTYIFFVSSTRRFTLYYINPFLHWVHIIQLLVYWFPYFHELSSLKLRVAWYSSIRSCLNKILFTSLIWWYFPFFLLLKIIVFVLSILLSTSSSEECLPNILPIFINFTVFLVFNVVQFSICLQSAITDVHSRKACLVVSISIVHIVHMFISDNFIT